MTRTSDHRDAPAATDSFRAQNGEDRWLDAYFGGRRAGFFVDVGAYDGVDLSNSYHFEAIGWTGVLVEPDADRAAHCRIHRPRSRTFHCAAVGDPALAEITFHRVDSAGVYSTTHMTEQHASRLAGMGCAPQAISVPARTLDSLLEEVGADAIDFVSIDVEGAELEVLRGFDIARWRPAIVVVESNTRLRLPAIRDYFVGHGYAYRHSIDVNDFYERRGAAGIAVRLADALAYARHRVRRRLARLSQNLRRAWRKLRGG